MLLRASPGVLAFSVLLSVTGMFATLRHMPWWIAGETSRLREPVHASIGEVLAYRVARVFHPD